MTARRLLVVGGNGLVGHSVCRAAVARGWTVTSLSRTGKPFATADGFSPAWVSKVNWKAGTPFDRSTYEHLLPLTSDVVSTLGILLESDYKTKGQVNPLGLLRGIAETALGGKGNPLESKKGSNNGSAVTYEKMNRDAALAMFEAFAETRPIEHEGAPDSTFVYLSAEDIFRPFVPARYIATKREAEATIMRRVGELERLKHRAIRPILVRPSLIYHPHINPLSTLPATLLQASSNIQSILPTTLRIANLFPPTTSATSDLPPAISSMANLATIPPIHVDTIAEAICRGIENGTERGVMNVQRMRYLAGFREGEKSGNDEKREREMES